MEYFVLQYPEIFPEMNIDQLNEQFFNYQLLAAEDIPAAVKESAGLEEDLHQVDNISLGISEKTRYELL